MIVIDYLKKLKFDFYTRQMGKQYTYLSQLDEDKYPEALTKIYYKQTRKVLDLDNPLTFNEKIQWSKLFDSTPIKTQLADKYRVRDWVEQKIGKEYLVQCLGVWDRFDDIDFKKLPNQFVLKTNNGSATNIIVTDKKTFDINEAKEKFDSWLDKNFAFAGLELQYRDMEPKIIAEQYLTPDETGDLPDYKFFCFDGKVFCLYTMVNYTVDHTKGKLGFFDRDYKLMPYYRKDFAPITEQLSKPKNFEKMIELAETLSNGFSHVRVDFYNIDGKIYFGEMTFTNASGYCQFDPEIFDKILGDQWTLKK